MASDILSYVCELLMLCGPGKRDHCGDNFGNILQIFFPTKLVMSIHWNLIPLNTHNIFVW